MTWLFSKALCESLHCSQEQGEESLGESCLAGEPYAQLNVMPTAQPFWRNDKMMESLRLSRFGLTLRLLTELDGEDVLMSFLEGFPARTSALLDSEQDSEAIDQGYGRSLRGWFAKYDHEASLWKTAQLSLFVDSDEFSETWPRWGLMLDGVSYLLPTAVHSICESESGLWPTPTVCGNHNRKGASPTSGDGLATAVLKMYPTPVATDTKSENMSLSLVAKRQAESTRGVRLAEAMHRTMLPTPTAGNSHSGGNLDEWGGSTNPYRGTEIGRLQLNPHWIEQLMGWPTGWTALEHLETTRLAEWQQQHGIYSQNER